MGLDWSVETEKEPENRQGNLSANIAYGEFLSAELKVTFGESEVTL